MFDKQRLRANTRRWLRRLTVPDMFSKHAGVSLLLFCFVFVFFGWTEIENLKIYIQISHFVWEIIKKIKMAITIFQKSKVSHYTGLKNNNNKTNSVNSFKK